MKRNKVFLLLTMLAILVLAACAGGNNEAGKETNDAGENNEQEQAVEVEKGLMNVEMTIPLDLLGEDAEELEKDLEENWDGKIIDRDDQSITVKMSKKEHKKMLQEYKEDIEKGFQDMIEDEELASIKDIQANKNYTKVKMIVDREGFENSFDGFGILAVGISSMFYQVFDGKDLEKEKIQIEVEDEATGEVFHETIYPDALEETQEELENLN